MNNKKVACISGGFFCFLHMVIMRLQLAVARAFQDIIGTMKTRQKL